MKDTNLVEYHLVNDVTMFTFKQHEQQQQQQQKQKKNQNIKYTNLMPDHLVHDDAIYR